MAAELVRSPREVSSDCFIRRASDLFDGVKIGSRGSVCVASDSERGRQHMLFKLRALL